MGSLVIARLTFREASRRWVLWVALLLGLIFLIVYALGVDSLTQDIRNQAAGMNSSLVSSEALNFFLQAGLYVVNFLTIIMTVLTSVDTLSGEIASGTIHTLVSKPIHRWEVALGKWLGFSAMMTLYLLLMAGGVMGVLKVFNGYTAPNALRGLGLMWLNINLLLSISFLGGSLLSTLTNGVLVFGLYGVAFIGGWIEQFGTFLRNQNAINIGIVCSLIMPSEALWRRAAYEMQSPLVNVLSGFSMFAGGAAPSPLMIAYAFLYAIVILALAVRQFGRRDL
jgi:ABC-type transport system involved in multi-copper enzyme maturation permease subunit